MTSQEIRDRIAHLRERGAAIPAEITRLTGELETALADGESTGEIHAAIGRLNADRAAIAGAISQLEDRLRDALAADIEATTAGKLEVVEVEADLLRPVFEAAADAIEAATAGAEIPARYQRLNLATATLDELPDRLRQHVGTVAATAQAEISAARYARLNALPAKHNAHESPSLGTRELRMGEAVVQADSGLVHG